MTILTLSLTSAIGTLDLSNVESLETLNSNDTTIGALLVDTAAVSIDIDGINASNTTVNGDNLTTATFDVGTNDVDLTVLGTSGITIEAIANTLNLDGNVDIVSIDNSSDIEEMILNTVNLTDILAGTAQIAVMNALSNETGLDITGSNILDITLTGTSNTFSITTGLSTTNLNITTTTSSLVTLTTNTSILDLTSLNADANIISTTLTSADVNVGTNNVALDLDKSGLSFTLTGTATDVTFTGSDIVGLVMGISTNVDKLILDSINVTVLDLTAVPITNLDVLTTQTDLSVTSNNLADIVINGVNLTSVIVNSTQPSANLELNTGAVSLDFDGTVEIVTLTNNSLTTLNLDDTDIDDLTIQANSLTGLDTLTSIAESLAITTTQDNFNLTTSTPTINFTSNTTYNLNFISTLVGIISLNTDTDSVDFDATNTTVTLDGASVSSVTGDIDELQVTNSDDTFTVDINADKLEYTDNTSTDFIMNGTGTVTEVTIGSSTITTIDTKVSIPRMEYINPEESSVKVFVQKKPG